MLLLIHGGAGNIKGNPDELKNSWPEHKIVLEESLSAGRKVLKEGGLAIDAVREAVIVLENSPLFNAGRGAVFNHDGKNEMDASIMDGRTLAAGAVGGVHHLKNPIRAAEIVMNKSQHVLLIGDGAEQFCKPYGAEIVDPSYFFTQRRYDQLQKALAEEKQYDPLSTVGAVAIDEKGNLAAATSTGGITNKRFGRVGDSAVIGAGTYANNESIAVSTTGTGDIFMQAVAAHNVHSLFKQGFSLPQAVARTLQDVKDLGGSGGIIAIDKNGNCCLKYNSDMMFCGVAKDDLPLKTAYMF